MFIQCALYNKERTIGQIYCNNEKERNAKRYKSAYLHINFHAFGILYCIHSRNYRPCFYRRSSQGKFLYCCIHLHLGTETVEIKKQ